ncbi:Hypothetical predicted protein [Paramuricea clavata]|uniref:Uncharacterized protein n=1 Tax=Paramuricea clavata TaxID=317549 RepID=A0A6S7I719_PARCT|nr:Hypothetical predicted protein [Paramuricea clavata]
MENVETYLERYGCEPSAYFILNTLQNLLTAYPYHPILWSLYSVDRYLYSYKPKPLKERRIYDYAITDAEDVWFHGELDEVRDVLLWLNPKTVSVSMQCVDGRKFYTIPAEWAKHLIVRYDSDGVWWFHYMPFEFCCRQILSSDGVGIIQCRKLSVGPELYVDESFYHLGFGACQSDLHSVYADLDCFVGLKRLHGALESLLRDGFAHDPNNTERECVCELMYCLSLNKKLIPLEYPSINNEEKKKSIVEIETFTLKTIDIRRRKNKMSFRTYYFEASFALYEGDPNFRICGALDRLADLTLHYYKYIDYPLQLSVKVMGIMQFTKRITPAQLNQEFAKFAIYVNLTPMGRNPMIEHMHIWAIRRHHELQKKIVENGCFHFGGPTLELHKSMILEDRVRKYAAALEDYLFHGPGVLEHYGNLRDLKKLAGFVDALRRLPMDTI